MKHKNSLFIRNMGLKKYWIINPERKTIQVFLHNGEDFEKPAYYKDDEIIKSSVLKGFQIVLMDIFPE